MNLMILLTASIYPLIGGPAVGKTSIIKELANDEVTVRETATDLINAYMGKGDLTPWENPGFEIEIIQEKIRREEEAIAKAKKENKKHIYVDRGLLDNLIYLKINGKENTDEYRKIEAMLEKVSAFTRYHTVFLVEPYNGNDFQAKLAGVRHETTEEALKLAKMIKDVYAKYYDIISVPAHMTPRERAMFIIQKVKKLESKIAIN